MKQKPAIFRFDDTITFKRLAAGLAVLGKVSLGKTGVVQIVYFDTFDWRLFAASKSLAALNGQKGKEILFFDHRRRQPIATVRGALSGGFVSSLPEGVLQDRLKPIVNLRRLLPCLCITSRQMTVSIRNQKGPVILRLMLEQLRLRLPQGGKSIPFGAQLTLTPLQGHNKTLQKAKRVIGRLYQPSKAKTPLHAEGLIKIGMPPAVYSPKPRLLLDPKMAAGGAVRVIHLAMLEVMKRNEDGIIKNLDSEFLHDFRTAVRRTRAALNQIGKDVLPDLIIAKAKDDYRWLSRQTSQMRDLDVYLIEYPKLLAALPASYQSSLWPFHDYLAMLGAKENKKVGALLRGRRYQAMRDQWLAFLGQTPASAKDGEYAALPVKELADVRIWKAYQRLLEEGEAIGHDAPAKALHELRLTGKALRYLMEFFQSLYPRTEIASLINAQKALQAVLGEFQDAEVQAKAILRFGQNMAKAGLAPLKTQMAMGMAAQLMLQRQNKAHQQFHNRFKEFSRIQTSKAFARLFKPRD